MVAVIFISLLALFFHIPFTASQFLLQYGKHLPQGASAVDFIYGDNGTFRALKDEVIYEYNYYEQYGTADHPYDKDKLVAMADGSVLTTCRDANGHLLLDFNHDGELDVTSSSDGAFFEHNGIGKDTVKKGNPFTNFWFDDNWLARYTSEAYGQPSPYGLSIYDEFTRWQILGGDNNNWTPYNEHYLDTLALDGLYYLTVDNCAAATDNWLEMLDISNATLQDTSGIYQYPRITENYHMSLFKILTEALRLVGGCCTDSECILDTGLLLQHSVSLRSNILLLQQHRIAENTPTATVTITSHSTTTTSSVGANLHTSSTIPTAKLTKASTVANAERSCCSAAFNDSIPTGWLSSISEPDSSLINTESTVLGALSLGCQGTADLVLEAGVPPLPAAPGFVYQQSYYALGGYVASVSDKNKRLSGGMLSWTAPIVVNLPLSDSLLRRSFIGNNNNNSSGHSSSHTEHQPQLVVVFIARTANMNVQSRMMDASNATTISSSNNNNSSNSSGSSGSIEDTAVAVAELWTYRHDNNYSSVMELTDWHQQSHINIINNNPYIACQLTGSVSITPSTSTTAAAATTTATAGDIPLIDPEMSSEQWYSFQEYVITATLPIDAMFAVPNDDDEDDEDDGRTPVALLQFQINWLHNVDIEVTTIAVDVQ